MSNSSDVSHDNTLPEYQLCYLMVIQSRIALEVKKSPTKTLMCDDKNLHFPEGESVKTQLSNGFRFKIFAF